MFVMCVVHMHTAGTALAGINSIEATRMFSSFSDTMFAGKLAGEIFVAFNPIET